MWLKHMDTPCICIRDEVAVIGRGIDADVRLTLPDISRRHCRVFIGPEGRMIEDMDSLNGTFLNGVPITGPVPLRHDDTIQIGRMLFTVDMTLAVPAKAA
jgi:pSer/pThr/pTyr-binding forkhead associated (FHA) protein